MERISTIAIACVALSILSAAQIDEPKPSVSNDGLTAEQVAIYRAALADFKPTPGGSPQLANITAPLGRQHTAFEKCVAGIPEPSEQNTHPPVHRLDSSVVAGMGLPLVAPWEVPQMRIGPPDPKSPHLGLLTLSEIAFDREHLRAIVTYDFNCGGLCGHGKMLALTKSGKEWKISKICGGWLY
ncbi:MAG TPA: hypothetical protein VMD99_02285 [Terriglobales bacterium]|nr:hypothetical protein [Terriglobales bacterium]